MNVTLRLDDATHAAMTAVAELEHVSLNTALNQAARQWVAARSHEARVGQLIESIGRRDAALFERLSDA